MHVGALVPPYYDSMIGKLLVHCNNRDETMRTMLSVVQGARIAGIRSNVELLRFLLAHPDVLKNDVDTRWAERVLMPQFLQAQ